MGSLVYDFLNNSFLFSDNLIENNFKDVEEWKIKDELDNYRSFCIQNYYNLENEVTQSKSSLKVFSKTNNIPISFLTQTALYIDQFVINDPLFQFTSILYRKSDPYNKFFSLPTTGFNKEFLSIILKYLKNITPFVTFDYVKLMPFNMFFEKDYLMLAIMPKELSPSFKRKVVEFVKGRAIVTPLELNDGNWIPNPELPVSRAIDITFNDENHSDYMRYYLTQIQKVGKSKTPGTLKIRQTLPDTPPRKDDYDNWIQTSIIQTAQSIYARLYLENALASNIDATYLCDNSFTADLLNLTNTSEPSIQNFTANQFINLDLPFIQNIDVNRLMEIRKNRAEVFSNFRVELERNFKELRTLSDPKDVEAKKDNIIHDIYDVQLERIKQTLNSIYRKIPLNVAIMVGSLIGSTATSGLSLLGNLALLKTAYPTYDEYLKSVKQNPSYLLWKVLKKKNI